MCMVKCPACKGRICDLIATAGGRVVLKVKCPECGRIVYDTKKMSGLTAKKRVRRAAVGARLKGVYIDVHDRSKH